MSVSVNAKFNAALIEELEAFAEDFASEAAQVAEDTIEALAPRLLASLQQTPGSVEHPIDWTSDRQRKAFFKTDGFGKGIPYQRTGKYAAGWFVEARIDGANVEIDIGNETDYAQFVGGSLNQRSRNAALAFQQQFHRNTGWGTAIDSVDAFLDVVREDTVDRIAKQYTDSVTTLIRKRSKVR